MSCGAQVGPHSWCEARTASGGGGKGVETGPLRPKTEGESINRLLRFVVQDRVCSVAAHAGDKIIQLLGKNRRPWYTSFFAGSDGGRLAARKERAHLCGNLRAGDVSRG